MSLKRKTRPPTLGERIRARLAKRFPKFAPPKPKVKKPRLGRLYFTIAQIAEILGWSYLRTQTWLKRAGALVKIGTRYYTTKTLMKRSFPAIFDKIVETGIHGTRLPYK